MLTFKELKPIQKQYVVEVMNRFDHKYGEVMLSDLKFYHQTMMKARSDGCPKLGYPNWLIIPENKRAKSVYGFPIPTESELEDYLSGKTERVIDLEKYSPLFKQTVKEYNLL